jgi:hypothetical protein
MARSHLRSTVRSLTTLAALATLLGPAAAQCGWTWLPGAPASGLDGTVATVLALPNGDVIAGGTFRLADATFTDNIARWDGTTWRALGNGLNGPVTSAVRMANGDFVVAGSFTASGNQPCSRIARWNGSSWVPLGPGLPSEVFALLALPNGDLIAGGAFLTAGAVTVNRIARWNGTAWSALGGGFGWGQVRSLALAPNGDIVAGGDLPSGGRYYGLQRWDGTSWQDVPGLDPSSYPSVGRIATFANGELAVQGSFSINNVYGTLARWNGTTMQLLTPPAGNYTRAMLGASNGDLWLGGAAATGSLARWNGAGWTLVAGAPPTITALAEDGNGRLVVGSSPSTAPRLRAVTRYDGVGWQTLGSAAPPPLVNAMVELSNGDVVVGGRFATFAGIAAANLARWNGLAWSPVGLGVDGEVRSLAATANGDLLVSGLFANAGGAPANRVARWNGQVWSTLGGGLATPAAHLAATPQGEVLAAASGVLGIQRFDGLQWSSVPFATSLAVVLSMAALPDGRVALGGLFSGYAPSITGVLIYSGGVLAGIPGASTSCQRVVALEDGSLLAYGPGLRRWDGTTWTTLPSVSLLGLRPLPDGDLIAAGGYAAYGTGAPSSVYRLRPGGWESFGGVGTGAGSSVLVSRRGELFVAGAIQVAAGLVSSGFAHAQPSCPAAAATVGAGCTGGAGPVTLLPDNHPWVGGTFRTTAAGLTANSLAVQLFGLQPAVQPLPGGAPGCSLFVAPVFGETLLPAAGRAAGRYLVPNQPSLVGQQLRMQVVGVELGPAGIVRLTSSNALSLTVGSL